MTDSLDPYVKGAASVLDKSITDVTKDERVCFKEAFLTCLAQRLADVDFVNSLLKDVSRAKAVHDARLHAERIRLCNHPPNTTFPVPCPRCGASTDWSGG